MGNVFVNWKLRPIDLGPPAAEKNNRRSMRNLNRRISSFGTVRTFFKVGT